MPLNPICSEPLRVVGGDISIFFIHIINGTHKPIEDRLICLPIECHGLARASLILVGAMKELDEGEKAPKQVGRKPYAGSTEQDHLLWDVVKEEGGPNRFFLLIVESKAEFA